MTDIDGRKEFAKAALVDGTVLTDVVIVRQTTRGTRYPTSPLDTVWFLGADDKGEWVYAPAHQVVRLHV